ncbi:MAG: hypothetical protein AAF591_12485 [Verrucomicrobiota bacterium]
MRSPIVIGIFVFLALAHQDFWLWDDPSLVFGFIPITLFYHASYSIVAAIFWGLVSKFAWPSYLEEWADEGEEGPSKD